MSSILSQATAGFASALLAVASTGTIIFVPPATVDLPAVSILIAEIA